MVPSEAVMTIISLKAQYQSAKGPVRSRLQMIGPPVNLGVMEATHSHAFQEGHRQGSCSNSHHSLVTKLGVDPPRYVASKFLSS